MTTDSEPAFFKLKPAVKDYIWGGNKLKTVYNKAGGDVLAESWEVSAHPDGASVAADGRFAGKTLAQLFESERGLFGARLKDLKAFPMLIKLIDARDNLSVQVHPTDEYALKHENQYGKTEAWYIVAREKGAGIYCGFKREISRGEYEKRIKDGALTDALNFIRVEAGQLFFIAAGTVHAIGAGITIYEIQQNSNVTYRVYDYGRLGADGKPRALHIEKAVETSNLTPCAAPPPAGKAVNEYESPLAACKYFSLNEIKLNGSYEVGADEESFAALTLVDGACDKINLGETLFIPAGRGLTLSGKGVLLKAFY